MMTDATDNNPRLLHPLKLYRPADQPASICFHVPADVPRPALRLFEKVHFLTGDSAIVTGMNYISLLAGVIGYDPQEPEGWHYSLTYPDNDVCTWEEKHLLPKLRHGKQLAEAPEEVQALPIAS